MTSAFKGHSLCVFPKLSTIAIVKTRFLHGEEYAALVTALANVEHKGANTTATNAIRLIALSYEIMSRIECA